MLCCHCRGRPPCLPANLLFMGVQVVRYCSGRHRGLPLRSRGETIVPFLPFSQPFSTLLRSALPLSERSGERTFLNPSQPFSTFLRSALPLSERSGERTFLNPSPLDPQGRFRSEAEKEPFSTFPTGTAPPHCPY
jgi:hypothetical protein